MYIYDNKKTETSYKRLALPCNLQLTHISNTIYSSKKAEEKKGNKTGLPHLEACQRLFEEMHISTKL